MYRAAEAFGLRIGFDVAVTGWDDVDMAGLLQPGLTTVAQPMRTLGTRAAEAMFTMLAGGGIQSVVLDTRLVIRGSCGPDCPPIPEPTRSNCDIAPP